MAQRRIIIGGVNEQVNLPITLCNEQKIFDKYKLAVDFRIVPEGTGKLMELVERNEIDIALMVTDAFIAGKASGRSLTLLGSFVSSPLVWVMASSPEGTIRDISDLKAENLGRCCKFGISRMGSGSYTMAHYANMLHRLSDPESLEFNVANNFVGLRNGLQRKDHDVFLWETFTTKPWIDREELVKVGEVSAPWPAFVLVGSPNYLTKELSMDIQQKLFPALVEGIREFTKVVPTVDSDRDSIKDSNYEEVDNYVYAERISHDHQLKPADANLWISRTRYSIPCIDDADGEADLPFAVSANQFEEAVTILSQAKLVPQGFPASELWTENDVISFCRL